MSIETTRSCVFCAASCTPAQWCSGCGRYVCWGHEPLIEGAPPAAGEHACVSAWVDEDAAPPAAIAMGGPGR